MKKMLLAVSAVAMLAACSSEKGEEATENGETAAAEASGGDFAMKAGEWEMTVNAMGNETVTKACITEEQAANPTAGMSESLPEGCEGDGITAENGKITGNLTCNQAGQEMAMVIDGTFSEDEYTMDMTMEVAGQTIETKTSAKHIGDCPA